MRRERWREKIFAANEANNHQRMAEMREKPLVAASAKDSIAHGCVRLGRRADLRRRSEPSKVGSW